MMGSMMSNLLGLNSLTNTGMLGGLGGFGLPGFGLPGFGFPGFGGCGPGFPGFCQPGCGPGFPGFGSGCNCGFNPCCCGASGASGPCDPCRTGFCVRRFRIVSPEGRECSFPVAVPWWCCPTGTTGVGAAEGFDEDTPAATTQASNASKARSEDTMSASQLLLQRYMVANPPRAFDIPCSEQQRERTREEDRALALREQEAQGGPDYGREYGRPRQSRETPEHFEIIPCPDCDDNSSPAFDSVVQDFHKSAVLIPSEET